MSHAGAVRLYGIAEALIPFPPLCIRPIFAIWGVWCVGGGVVGESGGVVEGGRKVVVEGCEWWWWILECDGEMFRRDRSAVWWKFSANLVWVRVWCVCDL